MWTFLGGYADLQFPFLFMLNWSSYSVLLSTRCIHCSFSSAFLLAFFVCMFSFHLSLFFAVVLGPTFSLSRIIEFYN